MDSAEDRAAGGRLAFRSRPSGGTVEAFDGPLGVGGERDGVLYVPDTAERDAPILVFFHGAGGSGRRELRVVLAAADRYGVVVVAPDSQAVSWDILHGGFGPDVLFLDRVLDDIFSRCRVDPGRVALGGVSDGASYALSIGLTNGDVFGTVIAFSPGFVMPGDPNGKPQIYISHGTRDAILPIEICSRQIAPGLAAAGYEVEYREFDGGHTVPPPIADAALAWWLRI